MTDRINTLTVVLESPIRTDDAQGIVEAIAMVRGVQSVEFGEVDGTSGARIQQDAKWRAALSDLWQAGVER